MQWLHRKLNNCHVLTTRLYSYSSRRHTCGPQRSPGADNREFRMSGDVPNGQSSEEDPRQLFVRRLRQRPEGFMRGMLIGQFGSVSLFAYLPN